MSNCDEANAVDQRTAHCGVGNCLELTAYSTKSAARHLCIFRRVVCEKYYLPSGSSLVDVAQLSSSEHLEMSSL